MKCDVAGLLRKNIDLYNNNIMNISQVVVESLEDKYPKPWICIIGKKFTANLNT
jgi:hypothetical protein